MFFIALSHIKLHFTQYIKIHLQIQWLKFVFSFYIMVLYNMHKIKTERMVNMAKPTKSIVEYRQYHLPIHFPVLLLHGDRWRISDIKSGRLHFHNCLEIGICHSESGVMEFEGVPVSFKAGDISCIPKNLPHTTYSHKGEQSLWSYIFVDPVELFRDFFHNSMHGIEIEIKPNHSLPYFMNKEDYPKIHYLVTSIIDELEQQKTNYQTSVKGLLLSLYIEFIRIQNADELNTSIDSSSDNALVITPALDFINTNYMQQFSIDHLANLCHLSVTHFRRVFHSIMGVSPLEFIMNTRIARACVLLRSTEDSILSISEQVGFHSISSFNRCFLKTMEVTPRVWRNQTIQSEAKPGKQSILEFRGWV